MKSVIKVISVCLLSILSIGVHAQTIDGSFGIFGGLSTITTPGGTDLASVTDISLSTVWGDGLGDGNTIDVTDNSMGAGGSVESLTAALTGNTFFTIEGWSFELTSLNIVTQESNLLKLDGTGVLSGGSFDPTNAVWKFSAISMNSYNMSVATVPVPAAVWLFGSGLLGLAGIARRKG